MSLLSAICESAEMLNCDEKYLELVIYLTEAVMVHKKKSQTVMDLCFDIKGQTAIVTGASSGLGVTSCQANTILR